VQSYPTWAIGVIDRNKSWKKDDTDPIVKLLRALPVPPSGIKSQPILTTVPAPMGAYVPGNNSAQSGQRTTVR
jgi:hypothetical protein